MPLLALGSRCFAAKPKREERTRAAPRSLRWDERCSARGTAGAGCPRGSAADAGEPTLPGLEAKTRGVLFS